MTYYQYIQQILATPTLCGFFQVLAADTWDRIDFVYRRPHIGISEVTITENLIYYLQKYKEHYSDSRILIQKATNEPMCGNDLLIHVQAADSFYYPLAVQAKRIYSDEKYYAFRGKNSQLQSLIDYAQKIEGMPLYLLYNFASRTSKSFVNCGITHDWNQFGCSFTSAFYVQGLSRSIPDFNDFHHVNAIPWMKIACCTWADGDALSQMTNPSPTYPLKGHTLNELLKSTDWINASESEGIALNYVVKQKEVKKFAPRYRLFFSMEK